MSIVRRAVTGFALLGLLLALVPSPTRAADPYEIDVIVSLTGGGAFLGKEERDALAVFETAVNAAGGVRGRPIQFAVQDDQSSPQIAVQLLNGVIAKHVPLLIGSTLTAACNAMSPLVANGPVMYCFSPGIHPPAGSYVFSASTNSTEAIFGTFRYFRERGWRKIAVLTSTDATGQDADSSFDAALNLPENKSVTVVDREHFSTSDLSVAAQMSHIKASGAQAAILWTTGPAFGTALRGLQESGLSMPISTTGGNLNYAQLGSYQAFMPNDLYIMAPPWAGVDQMPNGSVKRAVRSYLSSFNAIGTRPDQGHSIAWDTARMVVDALKASGLDATPKQIRDFIASQRNWVGISGVYDYARAPQRGIGLESMIMVRWDPAKASFTGVSKLGGMPL